MLLTNNLFIFIYPIQTRVSEFQKRVSYKFGYRNEQIYDDSFSLYLVVQSSHQNPQIVPIRSSARSFSSLTDFDLLSNDPQNPLIAKYVSLLLWSLYCLLIHKILLLSLLFVAFRSYDFFFPLFFLGSLQVDSEGVRLIET